MAKSRLQAALANEKGIDYKKLAQKKKHKEALRRNRKAGKGGVTGKKSKKDEVDEEDEDDWEGVDDEDGEEEVGEGTNELNAASAFMDEFAEEVDDEDADTDEDELDGGVSLSALDGDLSSSDSEIEMEEKIHRPKPASFPPPQLSKKEALKLKKEKQEKEAKAAAAAEKKAKKAANGAAEGASSENDDDEDDEEEEDEEEEDIALEDLEDLDPEDKEDLVPHNRVTIDNHAALLSSLNRISLPTGVSAPFVTHLSVLSAKPTADSIPDVQDDLQRELAFYSQSLEAAKKGRAQLLKEKVPFTRPGDYFAEMVKSDDQMGKVKERLVEEATSKKAAAEARRQRDLKKFGKQVQVAKEQERAKQKRETLDKIKTLKRKRQEGSASALGATEASDMFDVAVDNEIKRHDRGASSRSRGVGRGAGRPGKRQKKDEKYGFGGKKRHSKSGDAISSGDISDRFGSRGRGGGRGGRGGGGRGGGAGRAGVKATRPGKDRRKAAAGRM